MAVKRYTGREVTLGGEPTYPTLGKKKGLSRSKRADTVELANNSIFHGLGKVKLKGGGSIDGYYFKATDGSAKGVAWNSDLSVYRLKGKRDEYVAVYVAPRITLGEGVEQLREWVDTP